jgi:hypothetical protein
VPDTATLGTTSEFVARAACLAALTLLASGCITSATCFDVGVELAPDVAGWIDDLRVEPAAVPVQFRWRDDQVAVEIANWPHDPTYFMVYVSNGADRAARMLVHGVTPGWAGDGSYDIFVGGTSSGSGMLSEGRWIELPAHGRIEFWIDDLPWLGDPRAGDRIDACVDVERDGAVVTCPLRFHVARVFRRH